MNAARAEGEGMAPCPICDNLFVVALTYVGVGWVWHGVHCGWGHEVHESDVLAYDEVDVQVVDGATS